MIVCDYCCGELVLNTLTKQVCCTKCGRNPEFLNDAQEKTIIKLLKENDQPTVTIFPNGQITKIDKEKSEDDEPPKQKCPYCGVVLDEENVEADLHPDGCFARCKICGEHLCNKSDLREYVKDKKSRYCYHYKMVARFKYLFLKGEIKVGEGLE